MEFGGGEVSEQGLGFVLLLKFTEREREVRKSEYGVVYGVWSIT